MCAFSQINCLTNVTREETLACVLAVYAPHLPSCDEVLLCTASTSTETVVLFFRRALYSPHPHQTFCMANVNTLSYDVQVTAVEEFEGLFEGSALGRVGSKLRLLVLAAHDDTYLCNALLVCANVSKERFADETRLHAVCPPPRLQSSLRFIIGAGMFSGHCRVYIGTVLY